MPSGPRISVASWIAWEAGKSRASDELVHAVEDELHEEDREEDGRDVQDRLQVHVLAEPRPEEADRGRRREAEREARGRRPTDFSWKNAVAIRSAVSMPSRVIMSRANAKTPQKARVGVPRRLRLDAGLDVGLQVLRDALHVDEQAARRARRRRARGCPPRAAG